MSLGPSQGNVHRNTEDIERDGPWAGDLGLMAIDRRSVPDVRLPVKASRRSYEPYAEPQVALDRWYGKWVI